MARWLAFPVAALASAPAAALTAEGLALDVDALAADLHASLSLLVAIQWYAEGKAPSGLVWKPLKAELDRFLARFPEVVHLAAAKEAE